MIDHNGGLVLTSRPFFVTMLNYFLGTPRSLQIFFAKKSSISECLGTDDVRFETVFMNTECLAPSRIRRQQYRSIWRMRSTRFMGLSRQSYVNQFPTS